MMLSNPKEIIQIALVRPQEMEPHKTKTIFDFQLKNQIIKKPKILFFKLGIS